MKDQRSVKYYWEDKKTKELKGLYQEREQMIQKQEQMETKHSEQMIAMQAKVETLEQDLEDLKREKARLIKEAEENKTLPGFTVEVLS